MRAGANRSGPRGPGGGGNNPYANILGDIPDEYGYYGVDGDGDYGVPPFALRLLGPLAPVLLSDDFGDPDKLRDRLRIFSLSLLGTSLFFWGWAMKNTLHLRGKGGLDLGIFSFFGTAVSCMLLLRSSLGGRCRDPSRRCGCFGKKSDYVGVDDDDYDMYGMRKSDRNGRGGGDTTMHSPPGRKLRAFATLTQLTVVANYGLGVMFAFTAGNKVYVYFATYCVTFALLWVVVAFAGWVLVSVYREAVARVHGRDLVDPPTRPRVGLLRMMLRTLIGWAGYKREAQRDYYNEEDDEIDDELRNLYEGRGGYTDR